MRWYEQDTIHFAVGIEDTFIPQVRLGERPLDEYELTQHYRHWYEDLGLARQAGATMIRWGVPWYRVNPERGRWDWSWLDRVVDRLAALDLAPIVDLMHYGTPLWLADQFAHPDYPQLVAEYAARVAQRYAGRLEVFTPLNEPLLNVVHCGEFAYWPPYLKGHEGFVTLLRAISRGIALTQQAITDVTGGSNTSASFVHVEASFRFVGDDPALAAELAHLRERAFLVQDLVTGRVGHAHPLAGYLATHGFGDEDLAWARDHPAVPDVMGVNYYPAHSTERFEPGTERDGGPLDPRPRVNAWTDGLADVLTAYADRYGRPVFLTETSWAGSVEQRLAWLDASVACVRDLRARGIDVVGYTWWSLFDMVEWTYRHGTGPAEAYRLAMGLWDLVPDGAGVLRRVRNPVADRFRHHATGSR